MYKRQPNPCIDCNKYMKFRHLLDWARAHGRGYVVPGHYARVEQDEACLLYTSPAQVRGAPRKGLSVVFSGDTAPCPYYLQAAHDADLLICDCLL